jgi:hypothetical protein
MIIKEQYQEKSVLIYRGAFTVNLISILGNQIRLLPDIDYKTMQKIFRIFMELTQNVSYYSADVVEVRMGMSCGSGWVTVQHFGDMLKVTTGNKINPGDGHKLVSYCKEINSFNEEDLRKLKRDIRSQALERDTGAQIGLIQTSLISGNKLEFDILENEKGEIFFIISTIISKDSSSSVDD